MKRLIPILAFAAISTYLLREIHDFDIWWHIVIGRDIISHLAVPVIDTFTAGGFGNPYHDSHWLFQVVMALADKIGGISAVTVATAFFFMAIFTCIYRHCSTWLSPVPASILLLLVSAASVERLIPRPELVTFGMIVCFYFLFSRDMHRKPLGLMIFPFLQIIWVNSHGLFVIGPAMFAIHLSLELLNKGSDNKSKLRMSMILLLLMIATLCSPYLFDNWKYAWLLFTEVGTNAPQIMKNVGELTPTFGPVFRSTATFWCYCALIILALVSRCFSAIYNEQRRLLPDDIVILMLLALSFTGRRNIVLFVMGAAPYIALHCHAGVEYATSHLRDVSGKSWILLKRLGYGLLICIIVIYGALPVSGEFYERYPLPTRFGAGGSPSIFPMKLPVFLKRSGFSGQILNSNILGGFFLYHASPDMIPYIDGRWEVYAPGFFANLGNSLATNSKFERFTAEKKIRGILLAHGTSEAKLVMPHLSGSAAAEWRLVYYDYAASFWIRKDSTIALPPADLSAEYIRKLPKGRIENRHLLDEFFESMGQTKLRAINLQQALDEGFSYKGTYETLGNLYRQLGQSNEAESTYQKLLAIDPGNAAATNELAYSAIIRGDRERAVQLLKEGLSKHPENRDIKENLERITAPASQYR